MELLSTIGMIIGALLAAYERHRRKKAEQALQQEVDLLHHDPGRWLKHHFPGLPKKQDNGTTKTDD